MASPIMFAGTVGIFRVSLKPQDSRFPLFPKQSLLDPETLRRISVDVEEEVWIWNKV
jgi:hypothetical protein